MENELGKIMVNGVEMTTGPNGAILADPEIICCEAGRWNLSTGEREKNSTFTRYNGGWIKKVEGLDISRTDGYSLIGNFLKTGTQWMAPGLYLDCGVGGSRKRHKRIIHLFAFTQKGEVVLLQREEVDGGRGGSWPPLFWPQITKWLKDQGETARAPAQESQVFPGDVRLLIEERDRLTARLEEIDHILGEEA